MTGDTRILVTNLCSTAIVGNRVTWSDCAGIHVGQVTDVWEDQAIAVCEGQEHGMDFTAFVPIRGGRFSGSVGMIDRIEADKIELDRIVAEFGGFLPDLNMAGGSTAQALARQILEECVAQNAPLSDEDRAVCERLAAE